MDTRVAVISIIVENPEAIVTLNDLLHEAGNYIIGRMGIPYREKGINIISIAIDAPQDMISSEVCFPPAPCAIVTVWLSIFSLILFPLFPSLFTVTISIFFYTPYMK